MRLGWCRAACGLRPSVVFAVALGLSWAVLSVVYVADLAVHGATTSSALAWLYYPGVALYVLINGSLLFGSGLGGAGEYAVFVLGSALGWALLCVLLHVACSMLRAALTKP